MVNMEQNLSILEKGDPRRESLLSVITPIVLFLCLTGVFSFVDFLVHFLYNSFTVQLLKPLSLTLMAFVVAKYFYLFEGELDDE